MTASSRTLVAILCAATVAHAQPAPQSAAAVAQFDKGRALMKEKKFDEACVALAQSQTLDPQQGTLFNLAVCQTHIGKLASAWVAFRELAQRDANPARKKESAKQAAALEKRLPRLAITAAAPPPGLVVTLDGADVTAVVGTPSPIDLGPHEIRATAPHYRALATTTTVTDEGKTVTVPIALEPQPATAPPLGAAHDPAPHDVAAPPPDAMHEPSPRLPPPARSHRRLLGGIVALGGVAIAATGLVFGKQASDQWSTAKAYCGSRDCTDPSVLAEGNRAVADARSRANLSTGFVIGGGVVFAVGAIVFLTAPAHRDASTDTALRLAPTAGPDGAGLLLDGRF